MQWTCQLVVKTSPLLPPGEGPSTPPTGGTSYGSAKITLIAARKLHIKVQIKTLQKHNCVNMKAQKNCKR